MRECKNWPQPGGLPRQSKQSTRIVPSMTVYLAVLAAYAVSQSEHAFTGTSSPKVLAPILRLHSAVYYPSCSSFSCLEGYQMPHGSALRVQNVLSERQSTSKERPSIHRHWRVCKQFFKPINTYSQVIGSKTSPHQAYPRMVKAAPFLYP